ncbi:MAG: AraC family transcriptional regulator [Bacillota bacterium]|nr:AraC family transcriptional regulator [Bacillota bacterium]
MIYETVGRKFYIGYSHPILHSDAALISEKPAEKCFRLILIEKGSGIICFDKHSISFMAPALLCINELEVPEFKNCPDITARCIYFYPHIINTLFNFENIRYSEDGVTFMDQDCYLLLPFIHREDSYSGLFSIGPNTFSRVSKLFDSVGKELIQQHDMFWPCRSRSYFLELLILITKLFDSRKHSAGDNFSSASDSVENLISYLHNNYQEKITLDQLAVMFNTNRTSLNEQFYKATNFSIIDYLIKLRINLAATMLRDTKLPVSEIMDRVGFNDNAHFWRTFKKHTGLSPKEYRDEYCWIKSPEIK